MKVKYYTRRRIHETALPRKKAEWKTKVEDKKKKGRTMHGKEIGDWKTQAKDEHKHNIWA